MQDLKQNAKNISTMILKVRIMCNYIFDTAELEKFLSKKQPENAASGSLRKNLSMQSLYSLLKDGMINPIKSDREK